MNKKIKFASDRRVRIAAKRVMKKHAGMFKKLADLPKGFHSHLDCVGTDYCKSSTETIERNDEQIE